VNLCVGCFVEVAPPPQFHDHEVAPPVDVSVKRTFPLEPDSTLLKFAASRTGVGVAVFVAVGVAVTVAVAVVVVVAVALSVVDGPFTRSSLAITTPDVMSTNRTAIGPAGRETSEAPVRELVRTKPEPV